MLCSNHESDRIIIMDVFRFVLSWRAGDKCRSTGFKDQNIMYGSDIRIINIILFFSSDVTYCIYQ